VIAVVGALVGFGVSLIIAPRAIGLATVAFVVVTIVGTRIYLILRWGPPPAKARGRQRR
jgi:hypothetical protein